MRLLKLVTILLSASISSHADMFGVFQRYRRERADKFGQPRPVISVFSGFPVPTGPFYGQPFDLSATMTGLFPFTVAGNCEIGKIYTITKGADLLNYRTELECVYIAGQAPEKVPEGSYYGSVLSLMNTQLFNPLITYLWKGKMANKIECKGNETYIGWNAILNQPLHPFVATVQTLDFNLAPGENYDGKESLVIDYTQDLNLVCPDYGALIQKNYASAAIRRRTLNGMYPVNQIVDCLRLVGKQEDGGSIYIGKSYMKDFYRTDLQAATIAYWYIVNYDENAHPSFKFGDSLAPLITEVKYIHPGLIDFLLRVLPFDNLLTHPIRTMEKFVRGIWKSVRSSLDYVRETSFGGNFVENQRRFLASFNADRNFKRTS